MHDHYPQFRDRAAALFEYNIEKAHRAVLMLRGSSDYTARQTELDALGIGGAQVRMVCVILGWVRVSGSGRGAIRWTLTELGEIVDV